MFNEQLTWLNFAPQKRIYINTVKGFGEDHTLPFKRGTFKHIALNPSAYFDVPLDLCIVGLLQLYNFIWHKIFFITSSFPPFRDNMLRVVIYYDNMSYERLEQVPSYDTLLWLGKFLEQIWNSSQNLKFEFEKYCDFYNKLFIKYLHWKTFENMIFIKAPTREYKGNNLLCIFVKTCIIHLHLLLPNQVTLVDKLVCSLVLVQCHILSWLIVYFLSFMQDSSNLLEKKMTRKKNLYKEESFMDDVWIIYECCIMNDVQLWN